MLCHCSVQSNLYRDDKGLEGKDFIFFFGLRAKKAFVNCHGILPL